MSYIYVDYEPGIALTESKVSAICCNLFEQDGERSEGGNVITTTAFEDRVMAFRDLTKDSICHSCNNDMCHQINTLLTKWQNEKLSSESCNKKKKPYNSPCLHICIAENRMIELQYGQQRKYWLHFCRCRP